MKFIDQNIANIEKALLKDSFFSSSKFSLLDGEFGKNTLYAELILRGGHDYLIEKIQVNVENYLNDYFSEKNHLRDYGLCEGITGLLFFNNFIINEFGESLIDQETIEIIEKKIMQECLTSIHEGNWDYLYGALGFINTALLNEEAFERNLSDILKLTEVLGTRKKQFKNQFYWDSSFYNTGINLGLAHGLTGLMIVLDKIREKQNSQTISDILEHSFRLLEFIYYEKNREEFSFPAIYNFTPDDPKSRIAWCYGDLCILYALSYFENKGQSILPKTELSTIIKKINYRNKPEDTLVVDNCICHGDVGNAMMQKRINTLLNIPETEFNNWLIKTDRLFETDYLFYDRRSELFERNDSILNGLTGVYHGLNYLKGNNKFPIHKLLLLY